MERYRATTADGIEVELHSFQIRYTYDGLTEGSMETYTSRFRDRWQQVHKPGAVLLDDGATKLPIYELTATFERLQAADDAARAGSALMMVWFRDTMEGEPQRLVKEALGYVEWRKWASDKGGN